MESIDLAMEDIFDGGLEDEDLAVPPPLPDLDDDMPAGGEDGGTINADDQETEANDKTPKSAVKKRVLRPQPKLDAERLQSERGLPMLPKLFNNTKFKGKGHEADDLKLVMGRLEHWAHRLFPKLTFDDFTARLEKLGHTKPVQTCIKRIRLDMPVAGDDFSGNPNNDNMSGNEENDAGGSTDVPHGSSMDVEEAYEEMLRQERQQMAQQKTATPGGSAGNQSHTFAGGSSSDESSPRQLPCGTPSKSADMVPPAMTATGLSPQSTPQTKMAGSQPSMTPEQLARIERNKQLAMQKRAARLGVPVSTLASPKPSSKVTSDALSETMCDVDNSDTPTVTAATPPCHQVSVVAITTNIEANTCKSDSCDADAQAAGKDEVMSDETHTVTKNTSDKTINKCTPDDATMQNEKEILDAFESDHDDDDCSDISVTKDDYCVNTSKNTTAKNDICVDISAPKDNV